MVSRKFKSLATTAVVVILPVAGVVLASFSPEDTSIFREKNDIVAHAMELVDEVPAFDKTDPFRVRSTPPDSNTALTPPPPPRGAPIDAPAEGEGPARPTGDESAPDEYYDVLPEPVAGEGTTQPLPDLKGFSKTTDGRFFKATFERLSDFRYDYPDPERLEAAADPMEVIGDQIPRQVRALHEQPVVTVGYMLPMDITEDGNVNMFVLTETQSMCCYGVAPEMNEWAMVYVPSDLEVPIMIDMPVAVFGKLEVGEELEDGYIVSIYRISASNVMDVKELLRLKREEMAEKPDATEDAEQ